MRGHSDDILALVGIGLIAYALHGMWAPLAPFFIGVVCIAAGVLVRPKS